MASVHTNNLSHAELGCEHMECPESQGLLVQAFQVNVQTIFTSTEPLYFAMQRKHLSTTCSKYLESCMKRLMASPPRQLYPGNYLNILFHWL